MDFESKGAADFPPSPPHIWCNRGYTSQTEGVLRGLAAIKPETLAIMHGSSYIGPSDKLLTDLAGVIRESFNNGQ